MTSIRFFAAFHVLLYHQSAPDTWLYPWLAASPVFLANFIGTGYAGVNLFFVLSGFILTYNYARRPGPIQLRPFWAARFARIYPVYVLAFLITAPIVLHSWFANFALGDAVATATMKGSAALLLVQAWLPMMALAWNGPAWSLSAEAFFYFLFPFWTSFTRPWGRLGCRAGLVVLFVAGIAIPVVVLQGDVTLDEATLNVVRFNPLVRLPEFLFGCLLGKLFMMNQSEQTSEISSAERTWIVMAILVALTGVYASGHDVFPYLILHNGGLTALHGLLIYALASGDTVFGRLLGLPVLVQLGEASYAMYLLHVPLNIWMDWVDRRFLRLGHEFNTLLFVVYVFVVTAASLAAYRFLEEPARKLLRGKLAQPPGLQGSIGEQLAIDAVGSKTK